MTTLLSPRDIETLSTYLDGQLTAFERTRLESRLQVELDLRAALEEMRRTRAILRSAPVLRAPRNYTIKPGMVKIRQQTPRAFPILRLTSALASLLFVLAFVGDLIGRNVPALVPVALVQEAAAPETAIMEAAIPTQQTLMQSKAPPPPAAESAMEPQPAQAATEIAVAPMLQMDMLTASPAPTQGTGELNLEAGEALRQATEVTPEQPVEQTEVEDQSEFRRETNVGWWSSLRIFEAITLICAVATGLAALFLRRKGNGT